MSMLTSRLRWTGALLVAFASTIAAGQPLADPTLEAAPPSADIQPLMPVFPPLHMLDSFNRADGPLGANWVVQAGAPVIHSWRLTGSAAGASLATHVGGGGASLEADVAMTGAGTSYVALVLEYLSLSNNLFIKVQASKAPNTKFDSFACYVGNNGPGIFGGGFQYLTAPFTSAHMRVSVDGDRNVRIIFANVDGGPDGQVYTCDGAPISGGTRIGLGTWGPQAHLDNYYGETFPSGDSNGDGATNVTDVFYLINFLFANGSPPR